MRTRSDYQTVVLAAITNPNSIAVNVTAVRIRTLYGVNLALFSVFNMTTADTTIAPHGSTQLTLTFNISVAFDTVLTATVDAGGMSTTVTVYLYLTPRSASLAASPSFVSARALRGHQALIEVQLTNTGDAQTGPIAVSLPNFDWLAVDYSTASMLPGDQRALILSLTPPANLSTGRLNGYFTISGGASASVTQRVDFAIDVVSDKTVASFVVLVQDEYTFFSLAQPNVTGAIVRLTDALGNRIEGVTNGSGMIEFVNITEGTYQIFTQAANHTPEYAVLPIAQSMEYAVFLYRSLVTYTWSVVPVDVQDTYTFTLEAVFETYVPAPVVTITPMVLDLDLLELSGNTQIDFVATNWGLISANNPALNLPTDHPTLEFVMLTTPPATIPANTSILMPVRVSLRGQNTTTAVNNTITTIAPPTLRRRRDGGGGCLTASFYYDYFCNGKKARVIGITLTATGAPCGGAGGGGFGSGSGSGGGGAWVSLCD